MKSMKNLVGKMALVAGAALAVMAGELKAANIVCETQIPRKGWIRVVPELNRQVGTKVVYMERYSGYITGCVAPRENIRWSVSSSGRTERSGITYVSLKSQLRHIEANLGSMPRRPLPLFGGSQTPDARFIGGNNPMVIVAVTELGRFSSAIEIRNR